MNTKQNKATFTPRALREVWEWKEAVRKDMAGLTTAETLERIHTEADVICRKYGLHRVDLRRVSFRVAEEGADYGRSSNRDVSHAPTLPQSRNEP